MFGKTTYFNTLGAGVCRLMLGSWGGNLCPSVSKKESLLFRRRSSRRHSHVRLIHRKGNLFLYVLYQVLQGLPVDSSLVAAVVLIYSKAPQQYRHLSGTCTLMSRVELIIIANHFLLRVVLLVFSY